jgi:hypothetical protein
MTETWFRRWSWKWAEKTKIAWVCRVNLTYSSRQKENKNRHYHWEQYYQVGAPVDIPTTRYGRRKTTVEQRLKEGEKNEDFGIIRNDPEGWTISLEPNITSETNEGIKKADRSNAIGTRPFKVECKSAKQTVKWKQKMLRQRNLNQKALKSK